MRFPLVPKEARERTIVGAFDFFPARELTPTSRKERIVPRIAATVACQKEMPKPRKNDPYESARSETFAPHHGQKRFEGLPPRSDSAIVFVPLSSSCICVSYAISKRGVSLVGFATVTSIKQCTGSLIGNPPSVAGCPRVKTRS